MRTVVTAALSALLLAGCEPQEEARKRNEERLPVGCRIIDMDYRDLSVAVVCEGRKTTTSVRSWDETVTVPQYMPDGNFMMVTTIVHHRSINAEIGSTER